MDLPSLLSDQFSNLKAENDQDLFSRLNRKPADLVAFMEEAVRDQTWSDRHPELFKLSLASLSNLYSLNRLDEHLADLTRKLIHLSPNFLLSQITLDGKINNVPVSILLAGTQSRYLKDLFRNKKDLEIAAVSKQNLDYLVHYIHSGDIGDLWKWTQNEVLQLLKVIQKWELVELQKEAEQILVKFIDNENVLKVLKQAHNEQLSVLKQRAIDYFNKQTYGIKLHSLKEDDLEVEFFDFIDRTWEQFLLIAPIATHLKASDDLTQDSRFAEAVELVPKLQGLNLAYSKSPFWKIPEELLELRIGQCDWVDPAYLRWCAEKAPKLILLDLSHNTHLGFLAFGELRRFHKLLTLDLSHCTQIGNEESRLLAILAEGLEELNLTHCSKIGDTGFKEFAHHAVRLRVLELEWTKLSDEALIEFGFSCPELRRVNLSGCQMLSGKSIIEFLRLSRFLKELDLSETRIKKIQTTHPAKVIYDL